MLSDILALEEINLLKRKADSEFKCSSPPPPNKLAKIESSNQPSEEIHQEFNTYQYWKDPLPDIEAHINSTLTLMICDWLKMALKSHIAKVKIYF